MKPRTVSAIGGLLACLALVTACSSVSDSQSPSGAASAAESITLYNGRSEELVGPILAEFTKDTGIQVNLRSAGSGELGAQLLTEGDASPADVFLSQDAGALGAVGKAGMLATLPEGLLGRVPAGYRAADGTWTGISGRARVVVYNPELVEDPPDGMDEVVAGDHRGRIGYAPTNASWQSFVTGLRVLRGEDGARQWLEAFAEQDPKAYEGNAQVRDAVNAGEVALGLINHYYLYELVAEKGEGAVVARNQFLAAGDPGGLVNVAGVGVLATAANRDASLRLVDYLTSRRAQEYFAEETFEYPLIEGVPAAAGLPSLAELSPPQLDLSDLDSIAQTQALLADVGLLTQ